MPTVHVPPGSDLLLQDIADSLWKSKKVIVVTGAGISTNSGIPDFRSENGLYSLIQAQFDAASAFKQDAVGREQAAPTSCSPSLSGNGDEGPPLKRRKLSVPDGAIVEPATRLPDLKPEPLSRPGSQGAIPLRTQKQRGCSSALASLKQELQSVDDETSPGFEDSASMDQGKMSRPPSPLSRPRASTEPPEGTPRGGSASAKPRAAWPGRSNSVSEGTTPSVDLSSLPTQLSADSQQLSTPFCSSPLSSPPPVLFDPFEESGSGPSTSQPSSTSSSESGETPPSSKQALLSSQPLGTARNGLPHMKGRDLFDASIWSDPLKTSVFYTFTTTLRQKVRDVSPTSSHHFISHLRDTGKLVRCYTQNIDEIEEKVGLSTSLVLGPGSRGRFSARAGPRPSGAAAAGAKSEPGSHQQHPQDAGVSAAKSLTRDPKNRGVECVFLHGSLSALRCFLCGQTSAWDEDGREDETLSGRQPTCPRCRGATVARQERGKRALGVGKLRPDIVLYGEEHPNAHLISPIVQHDLSLSPDMMLIMGTSLKVHGLKVMVKEFAKAVHNKGGKVVFVNFTKPPESVWSDIIDFWVEWDCDAWVHDLKEKKPVLWLPPGSVSAEQPKGNSGKGKRQSGGHRKSDTKASTKRAAQKKGDEAQKPEAREPGEQGPEARKREAEKAEVQQSETQDPEPPKLEAENPECRPEVKPKIKAEMKPEAKRPAAVRDNKANGAYLVWKILEDLEKITGVRRRGTQTSPGPTAPTAKKRKSRQSAPAHLERQSCGLIASAAEKPASEKSSSESQPAQPDPLAGEAPAGAEAGEDHAVRANCKAAKSGARNTEGPVQDELVAVASKAQPGKRKRKPMEGGDDIKSSVPKAKRAAPKVKAKASSKAAVVSTKEVLAGDASKENVPWQRTDELISILSRPSTPLSAPATARQAPILPPLRSMQPEQQRSARFDISYIIAPLATDAESRPPWSHLPRPTPLEPAPSPGPLVELSPNLHALGPRPEHQRPFFSESSSPAHTYSPPQSREWNPTDQLLREADEMAQAALALSGLRGGR